MSYLCSVFPSFEKKKKNPTVGMLIRCWGGNNKFTGVHFFETFALNNEKKERFKNFYRKDSR